MKRRFLAITALVLMPFFLAQCSIENDNQVGCDRDDCVSFCEELGLTGGACDGDECVCIERDTLPYDWSPREDDTESDSGTVAADTSSDSSTDTDL